MSDLSSDKAGYGDFPFALTDGPSESRFLTWLRNHSNYMAVGGFLDYLRIAAVRTRGIFSNALIFSPPLRRTRSAIPGSTMGGGARPRSCR